MSTVERFVMPDGLDKVVIIGATINKRGPHKDSFGQVGIVMKGSLSDWVFEQYSDAVEARYDGPGKGAVDVYIPTGWQIKVIPG